VRDPARLIGALPAGWCLALAGALGAAMALAQPPLSLAFLLFLCLPPLLWLVDAASGWRAAFGVGWAAGAGYFAAGLFWLVEPFMVDPERHGWMAPFALVVMAGGLALFWAVAFAVARALWRPGWERVLILASTWTAVEFARTHLFGGFPWALVGYAWVETPAIQAVALFGPHMLGFLTLTAALLPGAALARNLPGTARAGLVLAAAAMLGASFGWGALRLADPVPERETPLTVRLVQPNAAQHLKWRADMQQAFYERHLALTRAPGDPPPDVTIWSETAVPFVLDYAGALQAEAAGAVGPDGLLILGIRRLEADPEAERWYNSLAVLAPDGRVLATYDKHHLVPFGEYIPLDGWIARLGLPGLETLTRSGFSAGDGPHLVGAPGLPPFLPLICYEVIFPHQLAAPEGRAEWMVQVTNDGWFGTLAGPYQHLAQARVRAIEQGLPLARVANTGVSAMIDPMGRVLESLPLGAAGRIDATLPAALPATLYVRWGDWPAVGLVASIFLLTVTSFLRSISLPAIR
jgi:apolipoprotein N-acyltransferase